MQGDMHKVNAGHLKRGAYLYIRQSTPRQVLENTESTKRQYALRQRATALGWHADRIVLIDSDLGHSAALAADPDREGFQRLVSEVGMGRAGLVIGLEVSRLARNSSDWHRLLEICALTDTLILNEEGLYDPTRLEYPFERVTYSSLCRTAMASQSNFRFAVSLALNSSLRRRDASCKRTRIATAISAGDWVTITSSPGVKSRPATPVGVLTMALPMAIASRILMFVPAETTIGATTTAALA
jgi:hypothetical protein